MPPKLVFQRPFTRIVAVAFCVAWAISAAAIAGGALGASLIHRVVIAVGALFTLVFLFPLAWRQFWSPQPTLRIDYEGLEGTFGQVRWADVDRALIGHRGGWRPSIGRRVRLELKNGAPAPRPPNADYASALIAANAVVTETVIVLPLWSSRRAVAEDLQQYAPGLLR